MRLFVAVTDSEWFDLHASNSHVDEVNFWRPSPQASFKALSTGELLLFKLHSPDNFIAGGGFFVKFLQLPVNLAWDSFREANGVRTLQEMRDRIAFYRRVAAIINLKSRILREFKKRERPWFATFSRNATFTIETVK
jgi:putative restriction endonuclease